MRVSFSSELIEKAIQAALLENMHRQRDWVEAMLESTSDEELCGILTSMLKAIDDDNLVAYNYYEWVLKHSVFPTKVGLEPPYSLPYFNRDIIKLLQIKERTRIAAIKMRRAQSSQRLAQSDLKSISLDASMPVPPTMLVLSRGRIMSAIQGA